MRSAASGSKRFRPTSGVTAVLGLTCSLRPSRGQVNGSYSGGAQTAPSRGPQRIGDSLSAVLRLTTLPTRIGRIADRVRGGRPTRGNSNVGGCLSTTGRNAPRAMEVVHRVARSHFDAGTCGAVDRAGDHAPAWSNDAPALLKQLQVGRVLRVLRLCAGHGGPLHS